ncbi:hypothetical protein MMC07_003329 [Pseudocyphellaria aurata]|nr:hypothetical protein [Pseudocyphellaria aurata]
MVLVEYSDSDNSDAETNPPAAKESANSQTLSFQIVDRSDPHKIRVNLPKTSKTAADDADDGTEPPSKRAKLGTSSFAGFNSLLPAPKKATAPSGGKSTGLVKKGGLGRGFNLKTGATPGFSREEMPLSYDRNEDSNVGNEGAAQNAAEVNGFSMNQDIEAQETKSTVSSDKKSIKPGNLLMFKPLSVTRKPTKKKPPVPGVQDGNLNQDLAFAQQPQESPKVSLFPVDDIHDLQRRIPSMPGEYQPMIYQASPPEPDQPLPDHRDALGSESLDLSTESAAPVHHTTIDESTQSLDSIASDLNLSASAKRQLLGRQRGNTSTINVVNFNTDQEYAANEILRQAGEQVQHNPVRSIAPGKHSLKQLVNAVSNQKDALEEQFASGRRNKKEAGSKYGW